VAAATLPHSNEPKPSARNDSPRQIASANSSSGRSGSPEQSGNPAAEKQVPAAKWGPLQFEALVVCRQGKSKGWGCNGPLDDQVLFDEPSLESAMSRQRCPRIGGAISKVDIGGQSWEVYRCGHAVGAGDTDIAKRYGLTALQRTYMCLDHQPADGRCAQLYDGQDKRN
jgi:hypothetical protein